MADVVSIANYARPGSSRADNTQRGDVRQFTQALNLCTFCGSSSHRASKCPVRVTTHSDIREI